MAKRRTIGDNPLDAVVPDPLTELSASRRPPFKPQAVGRKPRHPRNRVTVSRHPMQPERRPTTAPSPKRTGAVPSPTPSPDSILHRIECLEQENQCMKWLVGAILAPLALLAIFL